MKLTPAMRDALDEARRGPLRRGPLRRVPLRRVHDDRRMSVDSE